MKLKYMRIKQSEGRVVSPPPNSEGEKEMKSFHPQLFIKALHELGITAQRVTETFKKFQAIIDQLPDMAEKESGQEQGEKE